MKKIILAALLLTIVWTGQIFSQAGIKIGPMVGLTAPTGDFGGETQDFYTGTKYGMKSGVHFGLLGKIQFGPLNGRASLSYVSLSNSGNSDINNSNSTVEVKNNIFLITLGTEFGFGIPLVPVRPYAGIDILFSTISGTYNFQGTSEVSSGEYSIKSATRTGLGLAIGSEIGFGKTFNLDISLRYNLLNLFGKSYDGVTNSNNRNDAYSSLNDAADPNYSSTNTKHPIGSSRNISTIQLNAALLFGF